MPLYPLKLRPILKEKIWGGHRLSQLGKSASTGKKIGESWELADLDQTAASGGGGAPEHSLIDNGPLAGRSLRWAIQEFGPSLMGGLETTPSGGFPILLKYLDAQENLSLQVHPSAAYAASHAGAYLKSEAWYVVDARPGSAIYKGLIPGTTPDTLRKAIAENRVEPLLIRIPVQPGDIHYLPSGTLHALGAGIVVAEVQTPSDTTFRVYDWGRAGRELHVEQAMQCISFDPPDTDRYEPQRHFDHGPLKVTSLVACEHFNIDKFRALPGHRLPLQQRHPLAWMILHGVGAITCGKETIPLRAGDTVLLPPDMPRAQLAVDQELTWLEISFPQAGVNTIDYAGPTETLPYA